MLSPQLLKHQQRSFSTSCSSLRLRTTPIGYGCKASVSGTAITSSFRFARIIVIALWPRQLLHRLAHPPAVTNHTRHPLRLKAELQHVVHSSSSSSVHSVPFDLPYSSFTVDALSTTTLPIVFVPLYDAAAAARLLLRKSGAVSDGGNDGSDTDGSDGECVAVNVTGKGCRGLLSISRACTKALIPASGDGSSAGEQRISVKNRIGLPLPFVVTQSGAASVAPCNGCIPAYGSVTLVAGDDGGRGRGCAASVCIVRELLERSFKSALLV